MSATISECGLYRYMLERRWPHGTGEVLWVMLNPSTADANIDDPTITRCIGYAKSWGYAGIMVGNLYAWRATDPKDLFAQYDVGCAEIIGRDNDQHLCRMAACAQLIVVAWGGWGGHAKYARRPVRVIELLKDYGNIFCIGKTKDGQPLHPLYKSKRLKPVLYASNGSTVETI